MKAALEDSIEVFKEKMKETKSLEKQLQVRGFVLVKLSCSFSSAFESMLVKCK